MGAMAIGRDGSNAMDPRSPVPQVQYVPYPPMLRFASTAPGDTKGSSRHLLLQKRYGTLSFLQPIDHSCSSFQGRVFS
jgi:hypothetical protein